MESQPQNPEFRNNPENFHPWCWKCHKIFFFYYFSLDFYEKLHHSLCLEIYFR